MRGWLCGSVCRGVPGSEQAADSLRTHLESLVPFGTRGWAVEAPEGLVLSRLRPSRLPQQRRRGRGLQTDALMLTLWRLEVQAHGAKALWSAEAPPQRAAAPCCVLSLQKGCACLRASDTCAAGRSAATYAAGEGPRALGPQPCLTPPSSLPFPAQRPSPGGTSGICPGAAGPDLSRARTLQGARTASSRGGGHGSLSLNTPQRSRSTHDPTLGPSWPRAREDVAVPARHRVFLMRRPQL